MMGSSGEMTGNMRERLNTIKLSSLRLSHMVNDIMDSSSAKNLSLKLVEESVSLWHVCSHVIEMTQPLVHKGVQLSFDIPDDMPIIRADQAVSLVNAVLS